MLYAMSAPIVTEQQFEDRLAPSTYAEASNATKTIAIDLVTPTETVVSPLAFHNGTSRGAPVIR
jgi:hypothetical protein